VWSTAQRPCDSLINSRLERWATHAKQYPLGINIDRREKDSDARFWRWCIEDRRRRINSVTVAVLIIPIAPPVMPAAMSTPVGAVILRSSVLIPPVVIFFPSIMTIISVGRRHVYTADNCGCGKPQ
jgi:hypothetical protein